MSLSPLSEEFLSKLENDFFKDPKNVLAQNACSKTQPFEVCTSRARIQEQLHVFTHKVDSEVKPVTDQKSTGRCWIFACLNVIRIPFMKKHELEEFEFSQSYLFFWDKIERCNYFLNLMVETAERGETVDGRLVSHLLSDPIGDGGQWDMLVNLINKHGLMPKKNFPETVSSESSLELNTILRSKLREYAFVLRHMVQNGKNKDLIKEKIQEQISTLYRIIGICLSIPDSKFTWEYYTKSKEYRCVGPVSAVEFYQQYVKPVFNVDDKVCLVTDPRPTNKYNQAYTVDCLGNTVGGRKVIYNNQPIEFLTKLCVDMIKNNEPVWFGCQVNRRFAKMLGFQDLKIHDFDLVFGTDVSVPLSKADRLLYGESAMCHAMVLTAVSLNDKGEPTKWRVENSWGEERGGDKGYLLMTNDWWNEYTFEIVVDKKIVPKAVLDVFQQEPIVLPAWDPMGTLAH